MATVIFVHGTGGREAANNSSLARIEEELRRRRPELAVVACPWGDLVGYRLHASGVSIPDYVASAAGAVLGGIDEEGGLTPGEYEAALWGVLYQDPLGELRLLALRGEEMPDELPTRAAASLELEADVVGLATAGPSATLRGLLTAAGIDAVFDAGMAQVTADPVYEQALWAIGDDEADQARSAVARAFVASAIALARQQAAPPIVFDAVLRDQILERLVAEIGGEGAPEVLGWLDPVKQRGITLMAQMLTQQLRQRRGPVMDRVLSFIGDILLYQGQGATVRDVIRETVRTAQPPVVLLAHSLGGIACVDLLIQEDLSARVALLITVGSQAPIFYEIGALSSLRYDAAASLPPSVPPWLNIYDHQDFLSFVGKRLFPRRIRDEPVDNRQPFPYAHSAYWSNPAVWELVVRAIDDPRALLKE